MKDKPPIKVRRRCKIPFGKIYNNYKFVCRFLEFYVKDGKEKEREVNIMECLTCGAFKQLSDPLYSSNKCECAPKITKRIYNIGGKYGCLTYLGRYRGSGDEKKGYKCLCDCGQIVVRKDLWGPPKSCACHLLKGNGTKSFTEVDWQKWLNMNWGRTSQNHKNWVNGLSATSARSLGLLRDGNWKSEERKREILREIEGSRLNSVIFRQITLNGTGKDSRTTGN